MDQEGTNQEQTKTELQLMSQTLIEQAQAIVIRDLGSLKLIVEINNRAINLRKKYGLIFDPLIKKAKETVKGIQEEKDKLVAPLEQIIEYNKGRIQVYNNEQDRKRAEIEAKFRAEALKRQEEERLKEAVRLEQEGKKEEAEEVLNEKPQPVHVILQEEKIDGLYFVVEWKYKITEEAKIPREYLIPDEVKIGKVVRAMKNLTDIKGIEAYPDKKPRQRT